MLSNKNIAIIGAGWLGKSLANHLSSHQFDVKVSVRTNKKKQLLQKEGLNAYRLQINFDEIFIDNDFLNAIDVAIISLTPQPIVIFEEIVAQLIKYQIKNVILFSSTGIYTGCNNVVTEDSILHLENPRVKLLKDIEDVFLNNSNINATILRLGGLIGNDRHPVTSLAKKDQILDGNEPVNIIYKESILNVIHQILNKPLINSVFNLTENDHRSKREFYSEAANNLNLKLPSFIDNTSPLNRIVCSDKIQTWLKK